MNDFAGVGRQIEGLRFCGDVITDATPCRDVTSTRWRNRHADWLVKVHVDPDEALEHVRVRRLINTQSHIH